MIIPAANLASLKKHLELPTGELLVAQNLIFNVLDSCLQISEEKTQKTHHFVIPKIGQSDEVSNFTNTGVRRILLLKIQFRSCHVVDLLAFRLELQAFITPVSLCPS